MSAAVSVLSIRFRTLALLRAKTRRTPAARNSAVLLIGLLAFSSATAAEDIGPDALQLNGQGTRRAYRRILRRAVPFKVYTAQLYLSERSNDADFIIESVDRAELRLLFHRSVSAAQLRESANASFRLIMPDEEQFEATRATREQFLAYFAADGFQAGDAVVLRFFPNRVDVIVNAETRGTIDGAQFQRMIRQVWLGESLSDRGLRELKPQLLGLGDSDHRAGDGNVSLP